jgi:exosome complex component RRP4
VSSVCGRITRVNKLISLTPNKRRYTGEIGDLVIGRITSLDAKRWKVNIGGTSDASLQLSSGNHTNHHLYCSISILPVHVVNLPDGSQRIRTHEDSLQMREIFSEYDLVSAEIQNINSDGGISLHTRSLKYGKLSNGSLIQVSSSLVPRLPQHYLSLDFGVDLLLGINGFIWITRTMPVEWMVYDGGDADSVVPQVETLTRLHRLHTDTPLSPDTRANICRVRNSISALASGNVLLTPDNIQTAYRASEKMGMLLSVSEGDTST